MFQAMWHNIRQTTASLLISVRFDYTDHEAESSERSAEHSTSSLRYAEDDYSPEALDERRELIHRNDPCPCGSGLKYKQCHGRL